MKYSGDPAGFHKARLARELNSPYRPKGFSSFSYPSPNTFTPESVALRAQMWAEIEATTLRNTLVLWNDGKQAHAASRALDTLMGAIRQANPSRFKQLMEAFGQAGILEHPDVRIKKPDIFGVSATASAAEQFTTLFEHQRAARAQAHKPQLNALI